MLHRIIAKSYSIVTIIKVWSNVKRVRKNQISFEDIYIPLDTSRYQTRARTNFFFAMNRRIVRKIETRMMSGLDTWKTIAFVQSRGSASSSLNPYPRTTHSCNAYELSITRYHRVHERRYPYFSWYGQSREIVVTSSVVRALGSDRGNHRSRGWSAPLIHAATDFFPPPFYRSPRHRLDLVTWAWRNASYLLFCVSTFRDLDAADRSHREQW